MRLHEKLVEVGTLKKYVRLPKFGKCYLEYLLESDYSIPYKEYWVRQCIERYQEQADTPRETKLSPLDL